MPAVGCDIAHHYGEEGWRPAVDGHEHLVVDEGITLIVMHDALRPAFDEWLASRGLFLAQIPGDKDEAHIVVPTDEKFAAAKGDLCSMRLCDHDPGCRGDGPSA